MQQTSGGPCPTITPSSVTAGDQLEVGLKFTNFGKHAVKQGVVRYAFPTDLEVLPGSVSVNGQVVACDPRAGVPLPVVHPGDNMDIRWKATVVVVDQQSNPIVSCDLCTPDGQRVSSEITPFTIQRVVKPEGHLASTFVPSKDRTPDAVRLVYSITNNGSRHGHALRLEVPLPVGCGVDGHGGEALVSENIEALVGEPVNVEFVVPISTPPTSGPITICEAQLFEGDQLIGQVPGGTVDVPRSALLSGLALSVNPNEAVIAGNLLDVTLRVTNSGHLSAENTTFSLEAPRGINFLANTLTLNGRPIPPAGADGQLVEFSVPRILPSAEAVAICKAIVCNVNADQEIEFQARCLDQCITTSIGVKAFAEFPADDNYLESAQAHGTANEQVSFTVVVTNTGTVAAPVRLRAQSDQVAFQDGKPGVYYDRGRKALSTTSDLGPVGPGEQRRVGAHIKLPWNFEESDRSDIPVLIRAGDAEEILLGTHSVIGRSNICFDTSHCELLAEDRARTGHEIPLAFTVHNTGTTIAKDVCLELVMPDDLRLSSVKGVDFEQNRIHLGDIAGGAMRGLILGVQFTGTCEGAEVRTIRGRILSQHRQLFTFGVQDIRVHSQAILAEQRVILTRRASGVFHVRASVRNVGDGIARHAWVQSATLDGYIAGSTTVQERAVRDLADQSLVGQRLVLDAITPGQEVEVAWNVRYDGAEEAPAVSVTFGSSDGDQHVVAGTLVGASSTHEPLDVMSSIITVLPDDLLTQETFGALPSTNGSSESQVEPLVWDASPADVPIQPVPPVVSPVEAAQDETPSVATRAQNLEKPSEEVPLEGAVAEAVAVSDELPALPQATPWGSEAHALPLDLEVVPEHAQPVEPAQALPTAVAPEAAAIETLATPFARNEEALTTAGLPDGAGSSTEAWQQDAFDHEEHAEKELSAGLAGVLAELTWTPERAHHVEQLLNDLLDAPNAGWHRHIMAVKMLAAESVRSDAAGAEQPALYGAYHEVRTCVMRSLGRPRLQMYLRNFQPDAAWIASLHDDALGVTVNKFLTLAHPFFSDTAAPAQADRLTGSVHTEIPKIDETRALWAYGVLPALMPTRSTDLTLSQYLTAYRDLCGDFFRDLQSSDEAEVYTTMASSANVALDDHLTELLQYLRETRIEAAA